ncbi:hypothetical protein AAU57_12670 [Nonlabens sp. YIK11]|uniref:hypothetical protein n=1 Tax=Nonlabens sp. YIK11 TaxID=1453349 RepID=UPI0006DBE849|nr:hypothetical protein [Nonlabens sp. YIK11]KQC34090.1 hypothetical protein AAU57_12670 [Nonlabens sp. YIK11]
MDQLDILKSKWQSQKSDYPTYTAQQLTGLIAKKSSSIVKWIFYIGIGEFVLLTLINIFYMDGENVQGYVAALGEPLYYGSYIFSYVVVLFFIYRFWINYKNISADQPARKLMKNILKTRRTMKWYIWYNLIFIMIFGIIGAVMLLFNSPEFSELINSTEFQEHKVRFMAGYITVMVLFFAVFCAIIYGIYSLIYGILLRRLKRNYEELKKMEV